MHIIPFAPSGNREKSKLAKFATDRDVFDEIVKIFLPVEQNFVARLVNPGKGEGTDQRLRYAHHGRVGIEVRAHGMFPLDDVARQSLPIEIAVKGEMDALHEERSVEAINHRLAERKCATLFFFAVGVIVPIRTVAQSIQRVVRRLADQCRPQNRLRDLAAEIGKKTAVFHQPLLQESDFFSDAGRCEMKFFREVRRLADRLTEDRAGRHHAGRAHRGVRHADITPGEKQILHVPTVQHAIGNSVRRRRRNAEVRIFLQIC